MVTLPSYVLEFLLENKMYLFDFENQLASFSIFAKEEDGTVIKINSYFENTAIPSNETYYCWYTYIDENTVRVKFEPNSYMPSINTKISTVVLTTQGSKCNFEYTSDYKKEITNDDLNMLVECIERFVHKAELTINDEFEN